MKFSEGHPLKLVNVKVTLGEHNINTQNLKVKETRYILSESNIEVHPNYSGEPANNNDIAKVHLDEPIDFAKHQEIHPICLPDHIGSVSCISVI